MFGDKRKSNSSSRENYYLWQFLKFYLPGGIVLKIFESITGYHFGNLEFIFISCLTGVTLYFWFKSGENKNYRIFAGIAGFFVCALVFSSLSRQPAVQNESGPKFIIVVTRNNINIRSRPTLQGTPIGSALKGEKYFAHSVENGFYAIEFGSRTAYISAEYAQRE